MDERDALMVLDRRMRDAAAELRRAVDAAVGEASTPTSVSNRPIAPADLSPVVVEHSASPARYRRRWLLAAAVAVIVAAGVVGVIVVGGGDDDTRPATSVEQPFLLPRWLPAGWEPSEAAVGVESSGASPTVTVYSSSTTEDPWDGDIVTVLRVEESEDLAAPDADRVDVAGHDATIEHDDDTWVVAVPLETETLVVSGRGVTRVAVLDVATAAADERPVEPILQGGLAEMGHGVIDVLGEPAAGSLSLEYVGNEAERSTTIVQRPRAVASELGLIRLLMPPSTTATEIAVRGHPGVQLTFGAAREGRGVVQWIEPPGLLVTVWYEGLENEDLNQLIDQMRESTDTEIEHLIQSLDRPSGANDGQQAGEIVVAEGDRGANHWRVTAREEAGSFEVNYEDDREGFGFASVDVSDDAPVLEVYPGGGSDAGGETAIIGMADARVTDAVVEADGQPPLAVSLHRHDELTRTVLVGFIPDEYDNGAVVARNSRGRELARTPLGD